MRILVSEDRDDKFRDVKRLLLSVYPEAEITRKTGINSTVLELVESEDNYDLLIQDMMLPQFEITEDSRSTPKYDGGCQVLRQIKWRKIKIEKIVVVSSDNVRRLLDDKKHNNIPNVQYGTAEWRAELKDLLLKE